VETKKSKKAMKKNINKFCNKETVLKAFSKKKRLE
jgi:hypothetical protein